MKTKDPYHPVAKGQAWVTVVESNSAFYAFLGGGYKGTPESETAAALGLIIRDYFHELKYARIKQRRQYIYGTENFNRLVVK
jgi:hypothetical protein